MDLKDKIYAVLSETQTIKFKVSHEIAMREIEIDYAGEYSDSIKDWIGYGGLYKSIQNEYYDYEGKIILEENNIVVWVGFNGPFDGEFESVNLSLDTDITSSQLNIMEIESVDLKSLYVSFDYSPDDIFTNFTAIYLNNSETYILNEFLNIEQISSLKDYCKDVILSNIPSLNVSQRVNQNWIAMCEDNVVSYSICTDFFKVDNLDFSEN
jgi:hypothetical protein